MVITEYGYVNPNGELGLILELKYKLACFIEAKKLLRKINNPQLMNGIKSAMLGK